MAGIGFEIRKLLRKNTLMGLIEAYTYAGIIGSGPWILSIVGILLIGLYSVSMVYPKILVAQFQTSVTYLVASSLILSGIVQLAFTRFVSDRLFEKKDNIIMANLNGLSMMTVLVAGLVGTFCVFWLLPEESVIYRLLMIAGLVLLTTTWLFAVFLSGMKYYKSIVFLFAVGYGIVVGASYFLNVYGLEGLLGSFVLGHFVLVTGMWYLAMREYSPEGLVIRFDFTNPAHLYPTLMAVGFLFNFGVWIDKFMFWFFPPTSDEVIGLLRNSVIYDIPVFLAYLSIIPGMAVFLVRIETDFVEYYDKFYDGVRGGSSLEFIENMRDEMVYSIRQGLSEIGKIQSLAVLVTIISGPTVLRWLGISELYLPLLYVQVVGAGLQVGVMAILNVFFYLDQRRFVVLLCLEMVVLNIVLTAVSLWLGAAFYGYGFTLAMLITLATGVYLLSRQLGRLEYETFMLQ